MNSYIITIVICALTLSSCAQPTSRSESTPHFGGPCEGCEAVNEYGDRALSNEITLPDYDKEEPKLHVSGTIYKLDGKTPAKDVILYVYHTNARGIYPSNGNEKDWSQRHGYIRGWIKTGADGRYSIKTFRPASYPNTTIIAHIHPTVKEPGINEYYIDEFLFDDDPFLTDVERKKRKNRGGSGIMQIVDLDGIQYANRNIILGLNIPDYPGE